MFKLSMFRFYMYLLCRLKDLSDEINNGPILSQGKETDLTTAYDKEMKLDTKVTDKNVDKLFGQDQLADQEMGLALPGSSSSVKIEDVGEEEKGKLKVLMTDLKST